MRKFTVRNFLAVWLLACLLPGAATRGADGNRLAYLDGSDPYYVSVHSPS